VLTGHQHSPKIIESYFGTGLVMRTLERSGKQLAPHVAIQTAVGSGAHLTKYSNITDVETGQKKLIVDEAVVLLQPVFDYAVTFGAPRVAMRHSLVRA
jgi:alcohol dehydrogenase